MFNVNILFLFQETAPWLGRVARWLTPTDQMSGEHIARQIEEGDLVINNFDNIESGQAGRQIVEEDNSDGE